MPVFTRFDELRRTKAAKENRDLPLRTIAEETGMALSTIHRFKSGDIGGVRIATLEALCDYFDCNIGDLLDYKRQGTYFTINKPA